MIGAHFDSFSDGAFDSAGGTASLLAITRGLHGLYQKSGMIFGNVLVYLKTFGGVLVTHTSTVQLLLIVIHLCFIKVLAQILTTEKFPHSLDLILGSFRKFAMRLVNDYIFKLNYIHIIFKV